MLTGNFKSRLIQVAQIHDPWPIEKKHESSWMLVKYTYKQLGTMLHLSRKLINQLFDTTKINQREDIPIVKPIAEHKLNYAEATTKQKHTRKTFSCWRPEVDVVTNRNLKCFFDGKLCTATPRPIVRVPTICLCNQ